MKIDKTNIFIGIVFIIVLYALAISKVHPRTDCNKHDITIDSLEQEMMWRDTVIDFLQLDNQILTDFLHEKDLNQNKDE